MTDLTWLPLPTDSVVDASATYIARGHRLVIVHTMRDGACTCGRPGCEKPGKHPVSAGWQSKTYATPEEFRDALAARGMPRTPNVGIVMGTQLDGRELIAIDVDEAARLVELEEALRALPATLTSRSGGGGSHRLYTLAPGQDGRRLKNRIALRLTTEQPRTGVDVRWKGGQIVVCPSLHESGARYEWAARVDVAELPQAWFDVIADELPPEPSTRTRTLRPSNVVNIASRYLDAMVDRNCADIASRVKGERNSVLWTKACTQFEHLAGACVPFSFAVPRLRAAGISSGLPAHEVDETLAKR